MKPLTIGLFLTLILSRTRSTVIDTPSCFFMDFADTLPSKRETEMSCSTTKGCTKGACNDAGCMLVTNGWEKDNMPVQPEGGCLAANVWSWTGFSASMNNTNPFARIDIDGQGTYFGFVLDYGLQANTNMSMVEVLPSTNGAGGKVLGVLNNRNIAPKDTKQGNKGHRGFYTTLNRYAPNTNLAVLDESTCTTPQGPEESGNEDFPSLTQMHLYWAGNPAALGPDGIGAKPTLNMHNFVLLGPNTGDTTTIQFTTNVKDVKCGANFALYLATGEVTDPWGNPDPQNYYSNPGFKGGYGCSAQMFYGDANADRTNCFTYAFEFDIFEANNEGVHVSAHGALPDMQIPTKFIEPGSFGVPTGWNPEGHPLAITDLNYQSLGQVQAPDGQLGYYYSRQMNALKHQNDFEDCGPNVTNNLPNVDPATYKCYKQRTGRAGKNMWYGHVERVPGSSYGHTFPLKSFPNISTPYPHNRIVDSYGVVIGNAGQGVLKNFGANAYGNGDTNTINTQHDYDVKIDLVTGDDAEGGDWSFTVTLTQEGRSVSATVDTSDVSKDPIVFQGLGPHTSSLLCYKGMKYIMIDRVQYKFTTDPVTDFVESTCNSTDQTVQILGTLTRDSIVRISTECVQPAGDAFPGIVKNLWGNKAACDANIFECSTACDPLTVEYIYVKNEQGDPTAMELSLKRQAHRELGKMLQTKGMILTSSYWAQPMNAFPLFCDNTDCSKASQLNLLTHQTIEIATNIRNESHPDNGHHSFGDSGQFCLNALMLILQNYDLSTSSHTLLGSHPSGLFEGTSSPEYDSVLQTVQSKFGGVTNTNGLLSASSPKLGSFAEVLCFGANETLPAFNFPSQVAKSQYQAGTELPGGFDGFAGADTTWLNGLCDAHNYQAREDNAAAPGYYENLRIDFTWNKSDPAAGATPVENRYCEGAFSACVVNEGNTTGNFTDAIRECANDPAINGTLCDGACVAPTWVPPPPPPFPPGQAPPSPTPVCPAQGRPLGCANAENVNNCWDLGCQFGCYGQYNPLICVQYPFTNLGHILIGPTPPYNFSACNGQEVGCS